MDSKLSSPVRVSIPVSIANDLGSVQKAVGSVLDSLGCPSCCSGFDLMLEIQREVAFPKGLSEAAEPFAMRRVGLPSDPVPWRQASLDPEFGADIGNVFDAIARLAELSGHPACQSGFDIGLVQERMITVNPAFELRNVPVAIR